MRPSLSICALVAPALVMASADTAPLLAFSSRSLSLLDDFAPAAYRAIESASVHMRHLTKAIEKSAKKGLCDVDAVAVFEVQGLHTDSFRALPTDSLLKARATSAPSQFGLQYVEQRGGSPAAEIREAIARYCRRGGWATTSLDERGADGWKEIEQKRVVYIRMQQLDDESALQEHLDALEQSHPNHVVFIAAPAARTSSFAKRASSDEDKKSPKGSVFERYQLFSTGLLMCSAVILLIVLPIVYFALSMISAIQTPDRLGDKGRAPTIEKKNN